MCIFANERTSKQIMGLHAHAHWLRQRQDRESNAYAPFIDEASFEWGAHISCARAESKGIADGSPCNYAARWTHRSCCKLITGWIRSLQMKRPLLHTHAHNLDHEMKYACLPCQKALQQQARTTLLEKQQPWLCPACADSRCRFRLLRPGCAVHRTRIRKKYPQFTL